jgi:hypothetical protein
MHFKWQTADSFFNNSVLLKTHEDASAAYANLAQTEAAVAAFPTVLLFIKK